jgi:hypothetical protein
MKSLKMEVAIKRRKSSLETKAAKRERRYDHNNEKQLVHRE